MGADPVGLPNQEINIINTDKNTCTMAIYNFALGAKPEDVIGDIIIDNVSIKTENESLVYIGSKDGLKLNMGGTEIENTRGQVIVPKFLYEIFDNLLTIYFQGKN